MIADPLTTPKSSSRRALLAGALAGLGTWATSAATRVNPVRAADGDPLILGSENVATNATTVNSQGAVALVAESNLNHGVMGISQEKAGVWGASHVGNGVVGRTEGTASAAIVGESLFGATGVLGFSNDDTLQPTPTARQNTGVYGVASQDGSSVGVRGYSAEGHGVHGKTSSGFAGFFEGPVLSTKFYEFVERGTPAEPPANHARLFVKDNGSGHTQLCVRFHNGVVKVLATA